MKLRKYIRNKCMIMVAGIAFPILFLNSCKQGKVLETSQTVSASQAEDTDSDQEQVVQKDVFAMDTYMTLTAYGPNAQAAVDQAEAEINRLDALLSTGDADSEISVLNENKTAQLSEDGGYLVERALELAQSTEGAFDIAIYPIMEAWGFPTQDYQVPEQSVLDQLLSLTDISNVAYQADTREVTLLQDGTRIDLGGIAKGYTSARIMDIFKACGVTSGMVNLGGNVQVLGSKSDGSDWKVAIQSPDDTQDYLGILSLQDKAAITSGGYERYFQKDGVTYHHIIDPATGYPAENGLLSVTIVSADGTLADGLSTSLYIMGEEKAAAYWREHKEEFDAILETTEGKLYVTEGIADHFTTELEIDVIK